MSNINEKKLKEFIDVASEAAYEYDQRFEIIGFDSDDLGDFAYVAMCDEDTLAEDLKKEKCAKARYVPTLDVQFGAAGWTLERVVFIDWAMDPVRSKRAPSICTCPADMMAVFYA